MSGYEYAHDKPEDCRKCFFYDQCRSKCRLGKLNCYYLIAVDENEEFPCDTCPYHSAEAPCIGFCQKAVQPRALQALGRGHAPYKKNNETPHESKLSSACHRSFCTAFSFRENRRGVERGKEETEVCGRVREKT